MPAKNVKVKFGYCDYCEKEIEKPAKKPLDELQKTLIAIIFISTLGVAIIITGVMIMTLNPTAILTGLITVAMAIVIWLIYTKLIRKHIYCPECSSKLQFSKEAFTTQTIDIATEPSTPKEEVLAKIEEKKESGEKPPEITPEEEKEEQFCPFCGKSLSIDYVTCPYCQTPLKF